MSLFQVLLVAGTHGNEINAPWIFEQWSRDAAFVKTFGVNVETIVGNPKALDQRTRYLDRDLNRSFRFDLLNSVLNSDYEVNRAREILSTYKEGSKPCQMVLDFHSTTSNMGSSLVIYGRRPADLAFASLMQFRLGLPIYLHEGDSHQKGFLVEQWPLGLVVEIGPVPQNLLNAKIVKQTTLVLESCLEVLAKVLAGEEEYPDSITVHRHVKNIDFPRDINGRPVAYIHEELQGRDWMPINDGSPIFSYGSGHIDRYTCEEIFYPVFVNEAAYSEKNIAMSLTKRESWKIAENWKLELRNITSI